jgi:uncharacterized protein YkwD
MGRAVGRIAGAAPECELAHFGFAPVLPIVAWLGAVERMRGDGVRALAKGLAAAVAVAAAAIAVAGSPPPPPLPPRSALAERPAPSAPATGSYEKRILELVNRERTRRGLRPLRLATCADGYASRWSAELARSERLYHQSLRPIQRSCRARDVGENIGYGKVSAEKMVDLWMNSRPHRANILNPRFSSIGIGAVRSRSGHWYAVQDFLGF